MGRDGGIGGRLKRGRLENIAGITVGLSGIGVSRVVVILRAVEKGGEARGLKLAMQRRRQPEAEQDERYDAAEGQHAENEARNRERVKGWGARSAEVSRAQSCRTPV